jgi:hypothetical protein
VNLNSQNIKFTGECKPLNATVIRNSSICLTLYYLPRFGRSVQLEFHKPAFKLP